jgi:homoserine dehydrogenase
MAETERVIRNSGADIVVEATPTNSVNGEPASSYCRLALQNGKSVVTANKGPAAFNANSLKRIAKESDTSFEFEGSVMSGTPLIRYARESLIGAGLIGFEGILNGVSNFVLSCVEAGDIGFSEAVNKARTLGYSEADPRADIDGHDARLKVTILANELLGGQLKPQDVVCEGIGNLTPQAVRDAVAANARWKLIGTAMKAPDGSIRASVGPKLLPMESALAGVQGTTNAVTFRTTLLGDVTVRGPGAGRIETAYALLSDIFTITKKQGSGGASK